MRAHALLIVSILTLGLTAQGGVSAAQTAAPPVGAQVKDVKGQSLGVVEKIITAADGRPRQVEIRENRVLRTLPIDGLKFDGGAYVTVLTKAEFQALPVSE